MLGALALLLGGCAAPEREPPRSGRGTSASVSDWVSREDAPARSTSRSMSFYETKQTLALPAPAQDWAPRPGRGRKVDVDFAEADLPNAMQFLADAGGFNLVLEEGLTGRVSARLHGVEPYDALVALAEAHGAEVSYERRIVVVRRAGSRAKASP